MALACVEAKLPELYVILPVPVMVVPPVPTTSKLSAPPDNIKSPLMFILPPVPGTIPKILPVPIEKGTALLRLMVRFAADNMLPGVEYTNGITALSVRTLAGLIVFKDKDVPAPAIVMVPIVWLGTLVTSITEGVLKSKISVLTGTPDRAGLQLAELL